MTIRNCILIVVTITLGISAGYAGYILNLQARDEPTTSLTPSLAENALTFWSFKDLAGEERQMTEWAGKLVVVNFWATWCAPCRKEIPGFIALQERYAAERVQFIGIALDRIDPVLAFAKQHGINYPLLIGEEKVSQYMLALGNTIGALPFSAIIGRQGQVLEIHHGQWSEAVVDELIRSSL